MSHASSEEKRPARTDASSSPLPPTLIQTNEDRLRQLTESAGLGLVRYLFRPQRGFAYVSPALARLLGRPPEDFYANPDLGVHLAHPDDLALVSNLVQGLEFAEESLIRLRRGEGAYVWLNVKRLPILDASGQFCGFDAITIDVSGHREAELSRAASEAQFRAIFVEAPMGIALLDRAGRIQEANRAFEEILGYRSAELCAAGFPNLTHPDDLAAEARLFWELAAERRSRYQIEKRMYHRSGQLIWTRASVARQSASAGSKTFAITLLEDITERKRADEASRLEDERVLRRETFLAEISKRLADTLDFQTTLASIARLVIPELADWSTVDVVGDGGAIRRVAVGCVDSSLASLSQDIQDWQPSALEANGGLADVARKGTAILYREIHDEAPNREINLLASRGLLQRAGIHSVIAVPIRVQGRILGSLTLGGLASRRRYNTEDLRLAEEVANRAALAIESARAYQAEQSARAIAEEGERRGAYLAEVSGMLSASLDYGAVLENVARLSVPAFADWCIVDLIEGEDTIHRVAAACADPAWTSHAQSQRRRFPRTDISVRGSAMVIQSRQSLLLSQLQTETLTNLTKDPALNARLVALGLHSVLIIPIQAHDRILGALSLITAESRRPYTPMDQQFAEEIARRIALAVDNARLYREAREAIRAREEFMAVAAHELKTPVTGLRLAAQVAIRRLTTESTTESGRLHQALMMLDQQSRKLARLIEQLLDVARIEGGRLALSREETDLSALIVGAVATAREQSPERTIIFDPAAPILAWVDPLRFEQIITNLLDNARKYSPADRPIEVRMALSGSDRLEITVRDWGAGIAPEHRAHIFDRFYQAERGTHATGMGLGLYISQQIIKLHDGTLHVEFPSDGGSKFIIALAI